MSGRDDLARATAEARAQVRAARDALDASRDAVGGDPAKDARQAEQQLERLRGAVASDLRELRGRMTDLDAGTRRGATLAGLAGAGALAALVATGLAVRGRVRRGLGRREAERQARAIAAAMARRTTGGHDGARHRGRAGLVTALVIGAAVAGAAGVQQRRGAAIDPDDPWIPERPTGPA